VFGASPLRRCSSIVYLTLCNERTFVLPAIPRLWGGGPDCVGD
jgi:hypothetical protein